MPSLSCLTRVVIDDDSGLEVAQLQTVIHRIQCTLHDIPPAQRDYIANALLNLALARMQKVQRFRCAPARVAGRDVQRRSED